MAGRAGTPQFLALSGMVYAGTATSADEVDYGGVNGQAAGYAAIAAASHSVTGPTTTGPVFVGVNGTFFSLPITTGSQWPGYIHYALQIASAAGWLPV